MCHYWKCMKKSGRMKAPSPNLLIYFQKMEFLSFPLCIWQAHTFLWLMDYCWKRNKIIVNKRWQVTKIQQHFQQICHLTLKFFNKDPRLHYFIIQPNSTKYSWFHSFITLLGKIEGNTKEFNSSDPITYQCYVDIYVKL